VLSQRRDRRDDASVNDSTLAFATHTRGGRAPELALAGNDNEWARSIRGPPSS
jgi:hypothetical protein